MTIVNKKSSDYKPPSSFSVLDLICHDFLRFNLKTSKWKTFFLKSTNSTIACFEARFLFRI